MPSRSNAFEVCLGVFGEGASTLIAAAEEYHFQEFILKDVVDSDIALNAALNPFGRDRRVAFADVDHCGEHCAGVF